MRNAQKGQSLEEFQFFSQNPFGGIECFLGEILFLSGIGPREPGTDRIAEDFADQCRACFSNIRAVLEDSGSAWEKIVDVTVFLTDIESNFSTFNEVYGEHFASCRPTRTTVEVSRLPTPIAIELKVIATV